MRLFFAVTLSDEVKRDIRSALDHFPVVNPPWRWVSIENVHVTLKFLGEMEAATVDLLTAAAKEACGDSKRFTLAFERFGAFPNVRKPRVLFYSAGDGGEDLRKLAGSLDRSLHRMAGTDREQRPFKPHITVARIKRPLTRGVCEALGTVPPLSGLRQEVRSIFLLQSELRRSGAVYHPVKEIALA